jgi:hypothetical protein
LPGHEHEEAVADIKDGFVVDHVSGFFRSEGGVIEE